jgi:hypothetical protein
MARMTAPFCAAVVENWGVARLAEGGGEEFPLPLQEIASAARRRVGSRESRVERQRFFVFIEIPGLFLQKSYQLSAISRQPSLRVGSRKPRVEE